MSAVPNEQNGRITPLKTRGIAAMSGAFGYEMDLSECTAEEKNTICQQVQDYKAHYHLVHEGDYYRLTDPAESKLFAAWEHPFCSLRLKGLDPSLHYQVQRDGETAIYSGDTLMQAGYPLPLFHGDYQSLQLYLSSI